MRNLLTAIILAGALPAAGLSISGGPASELLPGAVKNLNAFSDLGCLDTEVIKWNTGSLAWECGAGGGGDFSDGGEAGGAPRSIGNTDDFDFSFKSNNVETAKIDDANFHLLKGLIGSQSAAITSNTNLAAVGNFFVYLFNTAAPRSFLLSASGSVNGRIILLRDHVGAGADTNTITINADGLDNIGRCDGTVGASDTITTKHGWAMYQYLAGTGWFPINCDSSNKALKSDLVDAIGQLTTTYAGLDDFNLYTATAGAFAALLRVDVDAAGGDFSNGGDVAGIARALGNDDDFALGLLSNGTTSFQVTDHLSKILTGLELSQSSVITSNTNLAAIGDVVVILFNTAAPRSFLMSASGSTNGRVVLLRDHVGAGADTNTITINADGLDNIGRCDGTVGASDTITTKHGWAMYQYLAGTGWFPINCDSSNKALKTELIAAIGQLTTTYLSLSGGTLTGNLSLTDSDFNVLGGSVNASAFFGDGSNLTGISAGGLTEGTTAIITAPWDHKAVLTVSTAIHVGGDLRINAIQGQVHVQTGGSGRPAIVWNGDNVSNGIDMDTDSVDIVLGQQQAWIFQESGRTFGSGSRQFLMGVGSSAAPALSWAGDPNTGRSRDVAVSDGREKWSSNGDDIVFYREYGVDIEGRFHIVGSSGTVDGDFGIGGALKLQNLTIADFEVKTSTPGDQFQCSDCIRPFAVFVATSSNLDAYREQGFSTGVE